MIKHYRGFARQVPRFPAKSSRNVSTETKNCDPELESKLTISYGTGQRIVREALRMVLEAVFDPSFLVYSHGHRPGRGEHSALKEVRRWVGITWFLKFRVASCHGWKMKTSLMEELRRVIGDPTLLDFLEKSISKKWKQQRKTTKLGRLLSNVYLHRFDLSVARTMGLYKRGDVPEVFGSDGEFPLKRQGVRHLMIASSPEYRRLWYVRHGSEFLMGFIGTREEAGDIFYDAKQFIDKLGIIMNLKKSGNVADSMQNPATFLGMRVVCEDPNRPDRPNRQETEWKTRLNKIEVIGEEDRKRRRLRKYVKAGMNSMIRAMDASFEVTRGSRASSSSSSDFWKLVVKHLGEVMVGPKYRNIYHVMSPGEILLNRRTQSVFPPELTEAAKELEDSLKAFVEESSKKRSEPPRKQLPGSKRKARKMMVTPSMTPPEFYAPITNIKVMLNRSMFLCRGRPTIHPYLWEKSEIEIVREFSRVAESILRYYKCTRNLDRVKRLVDYNLRFSCLRTLGRKHETTAKKVKAIFTTDLIVPAQETGGIALRRPYPTSESLNSFKQGFLARDNPPPPWKVLQMYSHQPL